ncbi:hypothetical protein [Aureimonas sp. AU40]|uniref:hypothetical protein n=1 Tax=Aureimonas sp. AU40 TaxID=1637747 RepID=UPI00078159FB|nr:hypothetical protein [Aureimonas sp. AU40]
MNILRFPSVRIVGASSRGSSDDARLEDGVIDPPLSRPPPFALGRDKPALHLLLAVTGLHQATISAALERNSKASAILDAFRTPAPVGSPANGDSGNNLNA